MFTTTASSEKKDTVSSKYSSQYSASSNRSNNKKSAASSVRSNHSVGSTLSTPSNDVDNKSLASSSRNEKINVPIEDIRAVSRWILFFCGLTDNKLCIPEVEELILYPPFIDENEKELIIGPMLTFQGMLQICGMSAQEWFEFVMRHDPVFTKTPMMVLPTFTKAIVKMCGEVNVPLMSDEHIRLLYRYFLGSHNAPTSQVDYIDDGFTAFDFAIAFAKHRLPADQIDLFNSLAKIVQQWGAYLRESHLELSVVGGISSKSMRTGIISTKELEKVLSNLYIKHQQFLRQMSRPNYYFVVSGHHHRHSQYQSSDESTASSLPGLLNVPLSAASFSTSNKTNLAFPSLYPSTLGAAESENDNNIPEIAPENDVSDCDDHRRNSNIKKGHNRHHNHRQRKHHNNHNSSDIENNHPQPSRKRSMLESVVHMIHSVRASFSSASSSSSFSPKNDRNAHQESAEDAQLNQHLPNLTNSQRIKQVPVSRSKRSAVHPTGIDSINDCHSDNVNKTEADVALVSNNIDNAKKEEEMQDRRRRRSVQHQLRYSALFTIDKTTGHIALQ